MANKTYWFDGEQIDEEDAFGENGIIRDGVHVRVPMMMRDSAGRTLVDAFGTPLSPNYGRRGYAFVDADNSQRCREHYDYQKEELSARWKGGLSNGDPVRIADRNLEVIGHNPENGKVVFVDTDMVDADDAAERAYKQFKKHLSGAWKKQKEPDEREWECAGPLSDAESAKIKSDAYEQSVRDLQDAWRK